MEGIKLESESPSFGIGIILFEDVDASNILPEVDWFFDSIDVEEAEKSWFASSKIAFNWNYSWHFYL